MADLLSHVLLAYVGCTIAGWYRPVPQRWTAVVLIGAILPDLNRVTLVVSEGTLEAMLGIPVGLGALSTLGGTVGLAAVGSLVVADRHRRTFAALLAGGGSHLLLDAVKAYADGAAGTWLYPLTWARHPTPSLYVSSEPWVLIVAAVLTGAVTVVDRCVIRRQ